MDNNWLDKATVVTAADKAVATIETSRQTAKAIRDEALNNMTYEFSDGRIIQTRMSDQALLIGGIEIGGDEWILADNTLAMVNAEELTEALTAAKLKTKEIFDVYKEAIRWV